MDDGSLKKTIEETKITLRENLHQHVIEGMLAGIFEVKIPPGVSEEWKVRRLSEEIAYKVLTVL